MYPVNVMDTSHHCAGGRRDVGNDSIVDFLTMMNLGKKNFFKKKKRKNS